MRHAFWAILVVWSTALSAHAQAQISLAMDHLKIGSLIEIMRIEGADYAQSLNDDLLNGQGGPVWSEMVSDIYNPQRMSEEVRTGLSKMSEEHLRAVNQFYAGSLGEKVIDLELAGRRAMMQDELKDLAQDAYQEALANDPASLEMVHTIDKVGDMVERNVTAALTANYRFYLGMVEGGAFALSEEEMLAEAWAAEDEVRLETTNWLMGYLLLSYQPLNDTESARFLHFTQSPAGRALNAAIFDGFGTMYADISYALGRAVALNMVGSDL